MRPSHRRAPTRSTERAPQDPGTCRGPSRFTPIQRLAGRAGPGSLSRTHVAKPRHPPARRGRRRLGRSHSRAHQARASRRRARRLHCRPAARPRHDGGLRPVSAQPPPGLRRARAGSGDLGGRSGRRRLRRSAPAPSRSDRRRSERDRRRRLDDLARTAGSGGLRGGDHVRRGVSQPSRWPRLCPLSRRSQRRPDPQAAARAHAGPGSGGARIL